MFAKIFSKKVRDLEQKSLADSVYIDSLRGVIKDLEFDLDKSRKADRLARSAFEIETEINNNKLIADANAKVQKAQTEADAKLAKAVLDIRKESQKEIDSLRSELNKTRVQLASTDGELHSKREVISSLQTQVKNYSDLVKFISTLVPEVQLSKFNVNVDVPSANVTNNLNK